MTAASHGPDRITLTGVRAHGHHGVLDHERRDGQEFLVDVTLDVDLRDAGASDDLADTVSYAEVADDVAARITGEPLDLIEALAARIADDALGRDRVEAVEVVVHKPHAPVGHPFDDVTVGVRRARSVPVVIALGANLGRPARALAAAVRHLTGIPGVDVDTVSHLVETDPVGGPDQPAYLNAVVLATTSRHSRSLLRDLKAIEERHHRRRDVRWGPRTLDLDLVQYGRPDTDSEVVSDDPWLALPHPRAHERAFVLEPWSDADPDALMRTPAGVARVADVLTHLDTSGVRAATWSWEPTW